MYTVHMSDPLIQVDPASPLPVLRQITEQMRALFVEGAIAAGGTLPSVRRLAIDLGVHFNTVAEAYRHLADEGWLDVSRGRPTRVLQRKAASAVSEEQLAAAFRARMRYLIAELRSAGLSARRIRRELIQLNDNSLEGSR
ncbi:MAG: GntR family transcriptional regulator [Terriglobales bacterium]